MSSDVYKAEVLNLFDNYIIKYIIADLKVLDSIKANEITGIGGCAIPQAIATFAALDLIGYLIHPQELSELKMIFSYLLSNTRYFPSIENITTKENVEKIRNDIRSTMVHRFLLPQFDITKEDNGNLFYEANGRLIFSTSHLTKLTILCIESIHKEIETDAFMITGLNNEDSIEIIKTKIDKL